MGKFVSVFLAVKPDAAMSTPVHSGIPVWVFILSIIVVIAIAYFAANYLAKSMNDKFIHEQQQDAENILLVSREKAQLIESDAKDNAINILKEAENEIQRRRGELTREDDRLQKKRIDLDHRVEKIEQRENNLNKRQSTLDKRQNDIEKMSSKQLEELQRVSNMTVAEAKQELLTKVEKEAHSDMARIIRQIEQEARIEGDKKARETIATAIQRVASDQVNELTTSIVNLPGEEMKGRIVGRNGRNIRAFEQAAGVDVIVDDTPEAVMISCFDPIRREIARRSLDRLIQDGRIHPAHIEKVLNEEEKEVSKLIVEAGEQATYEAGVVGLHPEIIKMLGRLKYRTSYGQNALIHSIEVATLSGIMASEIGENVQLAKRAGLLHDIGKSIDHEVEGTHVQIGFDICKKYKESFEVLNAIESHHGDAEAKCPIAFIVGAADAISAARPGARREVLETYTQRIKQLEDITKSYEGVDKAYAVQAGREVRIMVIPEKVSEDDMTIMAHAIARQIEEQVKYPGQIKVNVIRETRAQDTAK